MNRPPSPDDTHPSVPNSRWATTSPSALQDLARPRAAPHHGRRPQLPALTDKAHVWLARLPPQYQPLATARRHPHVVNRLAELWGVPDQLPAYFSELMMSQRPEREGFAFEVLSEMADLMGLAEKLQKGQMY